MVACELELRPGPTYGRFRRRIVGIAQQADQLTVEVALRLVDEALLGARLESHEDLPGTNASAGLGVDGADRAGRSRGELDMSRNADDGRTGGVLSHLAEPCEDRRNREGNHQQPIHRTRPMRRNADHVAFGATISRQVLHDFVAKEWRVAEFRWLHRFGWRDVRPRLPS